MEASKQTEGHVVHPEPEITNRYPPAKRDETLPCALFLFTGKCMEMIVQSIAEEIKVVEFHSPNPN